MAEGAPGDRGLILARLEVDYLRQLYYRVGERLCVRSTVTRMGTRSLTVRQELVQDDEIAIRADVVMVLFDFAAGTSTVVGQVPLSFGAALSGGRVYLAASTGEILALDGIPTTASEALPRMASPSSSVLMALVSLR